MEIPPYFLGLWCADGYWWSSSVGLSNIEPRLVQAFGRYLARLLGKDRVRPRAYVVEGQVVDPSLAMEFRNLSICKPYKMQATAYHVYVNSRLLLRAFRNARDNLASLDVAAIAPYLAGRFDGDGCWGTTPRIAYSKRAEAELDKILAGRVGIEATSVLEYEKSAEFCLYFHVGSHPRLLRELRPHSLKVARMAEGNAKAGPA